MIRIIIKPAPDSWSELVQRPVRRFEETEPAIRQVFEQVRQHGDQALQSLTALYDGVHLQELTVTGVEIAEAVNRVPEELQAAIRQAYQNIRSFHELQREEVRQVETMPGVLCWRKSVGIDRVGLYIPGGTAPLFSTLLMLGVPAVLAGCRHIVLCTPPGKDGRVHDSILFTASILGLTKIIKVGGSQAIAALTFGTETVPVVDKIFGPGNQYVTVAKQMAVQYGVAIDMPAGPSEVLVIADETADPEFVAADLLSQAEHGADSQVVLVTDSEPLLKQVDAALERQLSQLPRRELALQALQASLAILLRNEEEMIGFSNRYAPEHLILATRDPEELAQQVINAGSVFLGHYSPESAGDYASGTNHTLPTNGYARNYSGVSLDSFVKKITFQHLSPEGLRQIGRTVELMAEAEGLEAHKNAVLIRLNKMRKED
jgi:histidinol dehydrogenase